MKNDRPGIREACRDLFTAGFLIIVIFGQLAARPKVDFGAAVKPPDHPSVNVGGGLFLPPGGWSDGFDRGMALGIGVDFPVGEALTVGGMISRVEMIMDDRVTLGWSFLSLRGTYFPPVKVSPFEILLLAGAGAARVAVEVGDGKEEEWDLATDLGGGLQLPVTDNIYFRTTALWNRIFAGGGGFLFGARLIVYIP